MDIQIITYAEHGAVIQPETKNTLSALFKKASIDLTLQFTPADPGVTEAIKDFKFYHNGRIDAHLATNYFLPMGVKDIKNLFLFIATRPTSHIAQSMIDLNNASLWGGTASFAAAEYSPDNDHRNQAHEILHLLNVTDCYDEDFEARPDCTDDQCLMRYGLSPEARLCNKTVKELERFYQERLIMRSVSSR